MSNDTNSSRPADPNTPGPAVFLRIALVFIVVPVLLAVAVNYLFF
jgi:hypothetical protein